MKQKKFGGLKGIIEELMEKNGQAIDQDIINLADKYKVNVEKLNFNTVEKYIAAYKKKQLRGNRNENK